jgi:hypothetical protein
MILSNNKRQGTSNSSQVISFSTPPPRRVCKELRPQTFTPNKPDDRQRIPNPQLWESMLLF